MNSASSELTREVLGVLRRRVSEWARIAIRQSPLTVTQVATSLGKPESWLRNRLTGANVGFRLEQLRQIGRLVGERVPEAIVGNQQQLDDVGLATPRPGIRLPTVTDEQLRAAGSAQAEMHLLLEAAVHGRPHGGRDLDWMVRRFGVGLAQAQTLDEVGSASGVTRERVRQVEAKLLDRASVVAAGRVLPMLSSVHQRVLESAGLPWVAVEQDLRPFLGSVPLREAIRFLEIVQPPDEQVGMDLAKIYGLNNMLRVVALSSGDTRFVSQASAAARKIFSFAGAALVNDVRALLESTLKHPVALRDLVRTLDSLPDLRWLDQQHRWCWFQTQEHSALLRRVALILVGAGAPVDMDTLYAGLVREGRRDFDSEASFVTDPVPPAHVVHAILKQHPDFRRSAANSFTYVGRLEGVTDVEPAIGLIIQRLDALGGAATRAELLELANHPEHPVPKQSFANYFYCSGRIERIGTAAWAIRGRPISEVRRQEVLTGSIHVANPIANASKLRPSGPRWSVVVQLSASVRRNRRVSFPAVSAPRAAHGLYRMPEGEDVMLQQDVHGTRLLRLGPTLHRLLADPAFAALRFDFDAEARTLAVTPERGTQG